MENYFRKAESLYKLILPKQSLLAIELARHLKPHRAAALDDILSYIDIAHEKDEAGGIKDGTGEYAREVSEMSRPFMRSAKALIMGVAFALLTTTAAAQDACDLNAPVTIPEGGLQGFHLRVVQDYLGWSDLTVSNFLHITRAQYDSIRFCNKPPKGLYYALIKQARLKACEDKQRAIKQLKADKEGAGNE